MRIDFSEEAAETFQHLLLNNFTGFNVEITTLDGETFDAEFHGADTSAEWYDAVKLRRALVDAAGDFTGKYGPVETVRLSKILIY